MANVIEFSIKALDDFSANMNKLHMTMSKTEQAFASLGIAAAVYGAVRVARASLDNADAMKDMAEKAVVSVEALTGMGWAAKMSASNTETLALGFRGLSKAMSEGDMTPAGRQLQALGVSARNAEGDLRPVEDVFLDLADVFSSSRDDANKPAVAMQLLGKAGKDLVPLLNQGGDAIRDMMEDAKKLGVVISDDFAQSAGAVNDNLDTMAAVMQGSVNGAMAQVSPVIEQITGQFIDLATSGDNVKQAGDVIATSMRLVMTAGIFVVGVFKTVGDVIGGVIAGIVLATNGKWTESMEAFRATSLDLAANVTGTVKQMGAVWDENAQSVAAAEARKMSALRKGAAALQANSKELEDARKKTEELQKAVEDATASLEAANATSGLSSELAKLMELRLRGATEAQLAHLEALTADKLSQDEWNATQVAATELIGGLNPILTEHEANLRKIQEVRSELTNGQFAKAMEQENERWQKAQAAVKWYGISVASVAQGIGDAMAQTVVDGASLAKGLENVAKTVLRTVISTLVQLGMQRLILSALDYSATASLSSQKMAAGMGEVYTNSFASAAAIPVLGWAMAPGVAAANTAIAMAGAATSMASGAGLGGIAHGGLDFVPSESTFLLDKGERVLSPRQNEDLTGFLSDGGSGQSVVIQSLTIHVLENATSADAFTRMDKIQLRNSLGQPCVDALNEMFSIGIRPNFAMQDNR